MTPSRSKHVPVLLVRHVLIIALILISCRAARAEVVTLDDARAPIVRISIKSGDVTVRTWDRASVEVDGDSSLSIVRRTTRQPVDQNPVLIPQSQQRSRQGPVSLPAESFVVSTIPAGLREAIIIKSAAATPTGPVIVTIPNDSVYVFAFARNGNLDVRDYRSGTLMGLTTHGRLSLENVGGTVFVQTNRGPLRVADSALDRVRARSLFGNMIFERCRTRQIEATSIAGSIVYDSGTFEPGLAHFESTRGNVAIGAQGPAQLSGHVAGDGHVFTNFERGAHVSGAGDDAQALVGGGGPVVTATTQGGNVYLYDGSIRTRDRLPAPWRAPIATIERQSFLQDVPQRPAVFVPPRNFTLPFPTERRREGRMRSQPRVHSRRDASSTQGIRSFPRPICKVRSEIHCKKSVRPRNGDLLTTKIFA